MVICDFGTLRTTLSEGGDLEAQAVGGGGATRREDQ